MSVILNNQIPVTKMMNEEQISTTRDKLLLLKSELLEQEKSSQQNHQPVELDQSRVGRLTRMDAMQTQQITLETSRRRQLQLEKIEGALNRLATDSYGYCFKCGEEIDYRRLLIDPTITRCMGCIY